MLLFALDTRDVNPIFFSLWWSSGFSLTTKLLNNWLSSPKEPFLWYFPRSNELLARSMKFWWFGEFYWCLDETLFVNYGMEGFFYNLFDLL